MRYETEDQQREIQRWTRLAIQLIGAADSGRFDHITTTVVQRECDNANIFALLFRELPPSVWEISKISEVDRHKLAQHWQVLAKAYDPEQFHVSRNGLALLATYLLHLVDTCHAIVPQ